MTANPDCASTDRSSHLPSANPYRLRPATPPTDTGRPATPAADRATQAAAAGNLPVSSCMR
jgi:hypothetical protein